MRNSGKAVLAAAAACMAIGGGWLDLNAAAQGAHPYWYAWSPKPEVLPAYEGVNKPIWRLSGLLAAHKGHANWDQEIVRTPRFSAHWIQMAPGQKTRSQFYGDDRTIWVVWGGQIRFTIAGQKPFIASKGFLVEVPYRVAYSMETVGNEPSLRFEVTHAGRLPSYPVTGNEGLPPSKDGMRYLKVTYPSPPDVYTPENRMMLDFFKDVVGAHPNDPPKQHLFVTDGDTMADIIRGKGSPTPPPSNLGHFHVGNEEFWIVLEGRMEYLIEVEKLFSAMPGDVVFAPPGRWHRAAWAGNTMATRLAFNARPALFHNYGEHAQGRQR
jgi:mannose-6-phosphate isomerase-like protein (cupin superfamily)